jgi:hypothetical protein
MKPRTIRRLCLLLVLAAAPAALAQLLGGGGGGVELAVLPSPDNGKTVVGAATIGGLLRDGPIENITTIVKCFDTIRYDFIEARVSLLGVTEDAGFGTDLFPEKPGTFTATMSVYVRGNAKPLAEVQTTFTLTKPDSIEGPVVDQWRSQLELTSGNVEYAEKAYALATQDAKATDKEKRIADAAEALHNARVADFFGRIRACAGMALLYEKALDSEQALASLNLAQEIYDSERDTACVDPQTNTNSTDVRGKVTSAPAFMGGFARHFTRLGDLEKAVAWHQKEADWYDQQSRRPDLDDGGRKTCRSYIAMAYRDIAAAHVLLKNNLDEYKSWRDKASKLEQ